MASIGLGVRQCPGLYAEARMPRQDRDVMLSTTSNVHAWRVCRRACTEQNGQGGGRNALPCDQAPWPAVRVALFTEPACRPFHGYWTRQATAGHELWIFQQFNGLLKSRPGFFQVRQTVLASTTVFQKAVKVYPGTAVRGETFRRSAPTAAQCDEQCAELDSGCQTPCHAACYPACNTMVTKATHNIPVL